MLLQQLKITGLFNQFDYTIDFNSEENITILTGANGCGKTVILNIMLNFFYQKWDFIKKLVFSEINLIYDDNITAQLLKTVRGLQLKIIQNNTILYEEDGVSNLNIRKYELDNLLLQTYLIKEQRLLQIDDKNVFQTIDIFKKEVARLIKEKKNESRILLEKLNNTFTKKLLEEKGTISEEEFTIRYQHLIEKQKRLQKHDLLTSEQEVISEYNQENAKVLLVYLNDIEEKISVFDDLLEKIELFTSILNQHRFLFKSIQIDEFQGFRFINKQQKELQANDLSSGEQHEVVLLYELIFNTASNSLVLIDEPEISLHVAWQNEFLNDLRKIIKLKKMYAIVATHSPQIIDEYWDLTVNLNKQIV